MAKSDFWFSFPFRVRYSEIDMQGVVFNAHYLTYFDTAISEYVRALPYDLKHQVNETGTDFHIVRALVEYKAPIHFDDEIEVWVRAARLGRSSLKFVVEIHPKDADSLLTTGEVVWVNADQAARKSAPVPPALANALTRREANRLERG